MARCWRDRHDAHSNAHILCTGPVVTFLMPSLSFAFSNFPLISLQVLPFVEILCVLGEHLVDSPASNMNTCRKTCLKFLLSKGPKGFTHQPRLSQVYKTAMCKFFEQGPGSKTNCSVTPEICARMKTSVVSVGEMVCHSPEGATN